MRRHYLRSFYLLLAVAFTALLVYEAHDTYVHSVEADFFRKHIKTGGSSTKDTPRSCRLPLYDPFDATIQSYIKKWPVISCGHPQYPLTYLDTSHMIHLNKSAVKEAGLELSDIQCAYYEVQRTSDDDHIELKSRKDFKEPETVKVEFIVVRCFVRQKLQQQLIYESGHAQLLPLPKKIDESSKKAAQDGGLNTLILVLDSMSRLNFIRQLPKTHAVIASLLKATIMKGLTKVGDNTYPNMVVMLTGLASSRNQLDKSLGPFWGNRNSSRGHFDDLPAVWKNYSAHGYVTMFAEDHPQYTLFNYMAKGFRQPPTHFYMRPFWLAMDRQKKIRSKDNRCYGHEPKHRYLFNYTEQFVQDMHNGGNAYFALSFLTHLSHDSINSVQVIDEELSQLLTRLQESGALERTVLLIMGDHGNRFDPIRKTVIGRVEERMPFLAVALPPELEDLQPGLKANKDVLVSWHDVYELLMDVATGNLALESNQVRFGHRGLSLLRPIHANRTCSQVGVPREYCVCWSEKELDPTEDRAMSAGETMVSHVNKLLKQRGAAHMCAPLQLELVVSAQLMLPAQHVAAPSDLAVLLRVTARVLPSGALLEATLERRAWSHEDKIVGDVNRINVYGNQSLCIDDRMLRLYCFCIL